MEYASNGSLFGALHTRKKEFSAAQTWGIVRGVVQVRAVVASGVIAAAPVIVPIYPTVRWCYFREDIFSPP